MIIDEDLKRELKVRITASRLVTSSTLSGGSQKRIEGYSSPTPVGSALNVEDLKRELKVGSNLEAWLQG
jgi:hypothetical protein